MFDPEERKELITDLDQKIAESNKISRYNQGWDIFFKVSVLLISIGIIITSAIATSKDTKNPGRWSLFSTILGGVSTAASAFAFRQFNFSSRQQIWNIKSKAYGYLKYQIEFLNPDKTEWGQTKYQVDSWNDFTTPEQAFLPSMRQDSDSSEEETQDSEN